ncbi:hypothetical protein M0R45_002060 [Rubus argutus]|uniref:Uncharacterized protein n=1 Tax=Rubus argutus TaxID=59490 RepID=A0AAW1VKK0_RUBAR
MEGFRRDWSPRAWGRRLFWSGLAVAKRGGEKLTVVCSGIADGGSSTTWQSYGAGGDDVVTGIGLGDGSNGDGRTGGSTGWLGLEARHGVGLRSPVLGLL